MGKMETLTPVKSKPLNRLTHNLSELITSTRWTLIPNLVKIRSRGTSGQRGEIQLFVWLFYWFIYFFLSNQRREETPGRILTRNGSKDAESRNDVPFWGYKMKNWNLTPIYPQNPKNWPWIGNFQPKWRNMKLQVYQKVLYQSGWKYLTQCWERNTEYPDEVWWRHNESNMADGRHIENRLLAISQRIINRLMRNFVEYSRITF